MRRAQRQGERKEPDRNEGEGTESPLKTGMKEEESLVTESEREREREREREIERGREKREGSKCVSMCMFVCVCMCVEGSKGERRSDRTAEVDLSLPSSLPPSLSSPLCVLSGAFLWRRTAAAMVRVQHAGRKREKKERE